MIYFFMYLGDNDENAQKETMPWSRRKEGVWMGQCRDRHEEIRGTGIVRGNRFKKAHVHQKEKQVRRVSSAAEIR